MARAGQTYDRRRFPRPPIITPDGASYLYNYRLSLHDLYTVNGVR
jgi:hypothetical protein